MTRYRYQWNYRSGLAQGSKGDEVDLADDLAAQINVDSPGVLSPVADKPDAEPEGEEREVEAPPSDRMVHKSRTRGKAKST
jgi:hypothetical protein